MGEQVAAGLKWGCSSVGRAPALQAGGHEFESHHLHASDEHCAIGTVRKKCLHFITDRRSHKANAVTDMQSFKSFISIKHLVTVCQVFYFL